MRSVGVNVFLRAACYFLRSCAFLPSVRHVELVSSQWHASVKVALRVKTPPASTTTNASAEATKGPEWTEVAVKSARLEGCVFRVSLAEDAVCSGLQVCVDTRGVGASGQTTTVALHEVRLIAGDPTTADQPASAGAPAAVLDPLLVNQKALAQVLRRTGPVAPAPESHASAGSGGLGGATAARGSKSGTSAWGKGSLVSVDSAKDLKGLMKITMMGLKTIMWCVCNYDSNFKRRQAGGEGSVETAHEASGHAATAYTLSEEERLIVSNYFRWGLACVSIYVRGLESAPTTTEAAAKETNTEAKDKAAAEAKNMLECFASSFTVIEAHNFRATVGRQVPLLASQCQAQPSLFAVAQILLSNPNASPHFADVALSHVATALPELVDCACPDTGHEQPSPTRAGVLLHLFKQSVGSVSLFPDQEALLARHLPSLVLSALRLAAHAKQPETLLALLRQLFRSLSGVYGGHFEAAYDELKPVLPHAVSGLLRLRATASDPKQKALLTELCLTVPSRVEHLLPFLPLLAPVVTSALRANGELAKLGLRALEHWIDQASPSDVQCMCASDADRAELMVAVCAHLRPSPYPYGTLAIRILGKLGGRNRTFLKDLMPLPGLAAPASFADASEAQADGDDTGVGGGHSVLSLALEWEAGGAASSFVLPMDQVASSVVQQLERLTHHAPPPLAALEPPGEHDARPALAATVRTTKTHCLRLCTALLSALLDPGSGLAAAHSALIPTAVSSVVVPPANSDAALVALLNANDDDAEPPLPFESPEHAADSTNQLLRLLLQGLVLAAADVDLAPTAEPLLQGAVVHMCAVAASHTVTMADDNAGVAGVAPALQYHSGGGLSPLALNQVLVEVLCCEVGKRPDTALAAMLRVVRAAHTLQSGAEGWGGVVVGDLLERVCSLFRSRDARCKQGACRAVKALCGLGSMFRGWVSCFQVPLVNALLFGLKDSPREGSLLAIDQISDAMRAVFAAVYSGGAGGSIFSRDDSALLEVTQLLCADLTWPNPTVRVGVKRALMDLALLVFHGNVETIDDDAAGGVGGLACVARLLAPCRASLRQSVLGKDTGLSFQSLRAAQQVGVVDALTFVLSLPPVERSDAVPTPKKAKGSSSSSSAEKDRTSCEALLPINAEVLALLEEGMAFSDSAAGSEGSTGDDQPTLSLLDTFSLRGLLSRGSPCLGAGSCAALLPLLANDLCALHAGYPTDLPLVAVQLPMALCRALHLALVAGGRAFATGGALASKRHGMVGTFFKLLTSPSSVEPVVEAAQQALTFVITSPTHNKDKPLPKELLQECLKPVLSQIKSHATLTKSLLKGLARLLYLISNLFNKSLGETLLEHLGKWTEPAKIMGLQLWRPGDDVEVAAAIVGIFHLLPISPSFLVPLVSTVVRLEATHHLFAPCAAAGDGGYSGGPEAASPYREPVLKFLNRHKEDAVFYFVRRLGDPALAHLLRHLVKHPKGGPLRERLASTPGSALLVANAFPFALQALKSLLPAGATPGAPPAVRVADAFGEPPLALAAGAAPEAPSLGREMSQVDPMDLTSPAREGAGSAPVASAGPRGADDAAAASVVADAADAELPLDLDAPLPADADLGPAALDAACEAHLGPRAHASHGDDDKAVHGLALVRTLSDYDPAFVARRPALALLLRLLWRSPGRMQRLAREDTLPPHLQVARCCGKGGGGGGGWGDRASAPKNRKHNTRHFKQKVSLFVRLRSPPNCLKAVAKPCLIACVWFFFRRRRGCWCACW